jgi:hypothetical protein
MLKYYTLYMLYGLYSVEQLYKVKSVNIYLYKNNAFVWACNDDG